MNVKLLIVKRIYDSTNEEKELFLIYIAFKHYFA